MSVGEVDNSAANERNRQELLKSQQIADLSGDLIAPISIGAFPPAVIPEFYGFTKDELGDMNSRLSDESRRATCPILLRGLLYKSGALSLDLPGTDDSIVVNGDELGLLSASPLQASEIGKLEGSYKTRVWIMGHLVNMSAGIGSEQLSGKMVAHFASEYARSNFQILLFNVGKSEGWSSDDFSEAVHALDARLMTAEPQKESEIYRMRENWSRYSKLSGKYSLDTLKIVRANKIP